MAALKGAAGSVDDIASLTKQLDTTKQVKKYSTLQKVGIGAAGFLGADWLYNKITGGGKLGQAVGSKLGEAGKGVGEGVGGGVGGFFEGLLGNWWPFIVGGGVLLLLFFVYLIFTTPVPQPPRYGGGSSNSGVLVSGKVLTLVGVLVASYLGLQLLATGVENNKNEN